MEHPMLLALADKRGHRSSPEHEPCNAVLETRTWTSTYMTVQEFTKHYMAGSAGWDRSKGLLKLKDFPPDVTIRSQNRQNWAPRQRSLFGNHDPSPWMKSEE